MRNSSVNARGDAFMDGTSVTEMMLSVVIPVFNKERTIRRCVESALEGCSESLAAEIVLVDDGSTDGSADECAKLQLEYNNVFVLSQENQGVSVARNAGIRLARGKYVAFLDADDEVTAGSFAHMVNAFERYSDEADLLTYPITYVDSRKGTEKGHARQKWLSETGVYRLDEYPDICQTTINVCVKRDAALLHPFSTTLKMGEDQLFNTRILAAKAAIVFCAEANYRYTRDGSGASSYSNHPLNAFDEMIDLYRAFLDVGESDPLMFEYCNQMVLYNFWWRLSSGMLMPDFGSSEERKANSSKLMAIARAIPVQSYFKSKTLTEFQKPYLVSYFGLEPEESHIRYESGRAYLCKDDSVLWETNGPNVRIVRCHAHGNQVNLFAYFRCPMFTLDRRDPRLLFGCENEWEELEIGPSAFSICDAHVESTRAWQFCVSVPLVGATRKYRFRIVLDEDAVDVERISFGLLRANARMGKRANERVFEACSVRVGKGALTLSPRKRVGYIHEFIRDYRLDSKWFKLRRKVRRGARRYKDGLWLYADLPASLAAGNSLAQILNDIREDDGIARFYATDFPENLLAKYPQLDGHIVKFGSERHRLLFVVADTVLASYLDQPTYMPFTDAEWRKIGDLSTVKRLVYLQHGILHAHLPRYFAYEKKRFDYVVVSSQFEANNLVSTYHYPENAIIASGAPRLDEIRIQASSSKRKIIYAPSWRSYLVAGTVMKRTALRERLAKSSFFAGYTELLDGIHKSGMLERYGCSFEIKLHPNFIMYKDQFNCGYPDMILAPDDVDASEYAIMITDYSSYLYDFLYAGSRILYFLPDAREFEGGANHYSRLDLPFEEGFGPYAENAEDACRYLETMLHDVVCGETAAIGGRADEFFFHRDGHNSERLYSVLKNRDSGDH